MLNQMEHSALYPRFELWTETPLQPLSHSLLNAEFRTRMRNSEILAYMDLGSCSFYTILSTLAAFVCSIVMMIVWLTRLFGDYTSSVLFDTLNVVSHCETIKFIDPDDSFFSIRERLQPTPLHQSGSRWLTTLWQSKELHFTERSEL